MSNFKRILIVAYTFPPQGGIGGRRWAKIAKELHKQGYLTEVISAELADEQSSPWMSDVKSIPVFRFKTTFPKHLKRQPQNLLDKVRYRMALRKMVMLTKGTPYDRAALDKLSFLSMFRKRMQLFKPDLILATGAPFDLLHFTAAELSHYSGVLSVADLRDPWVNGSAYGYSGLSKKRLSVEKAKESEVVEAFDLVSMPWQKNIEELQERHPTFSEKLFVLPHFYDEDDLVFEEEVTNPPDIIYGGGIYEGLEDTIVRLAQFCNNLQIKAEVRTTNTFNRSVQNEFFSVMPPIPSHKFFARVKSSKYALLFLPEGHRYGLTKLYELAACGRPILAVGRKSPLSDLIVKESLGFFIDIQNLERDLQDALNSQIPFRANREWLANHSLQSVTRDFMDLVNRKLPNE